MSHVVNYEVVVGNIGTVVSTPNRKRARQIANEYIRQSKTGRGRAGGENVTIFRVTGDDVEIMDEYIGQLEN
jgi:hypothetical protein